MKIRNFILAALAISFSFFVTEAQGATKEEKKALTEKVVKQCRKDAKKMEKEGWKIIPGKLPLERQLERSQLAQLKTTDKGESFYFIGSANVKGGNYTIAKQMADNNAKAEIVRNISEAIASKMTQEFANLDLGEDEMEMNKEFIAATKAVASLTLQGVEYLTEIYREVSNGVVEAQVVVAVPQEKAYQSAKEVIKSELKAKSSQYLKDLDKVLPY